MGDVVIAAYTPKPGQEAALLALTRTHVPRLRELGLVTDRPAHILQSTNGSIIEIFEWRDGAIDRAHQMPEIHALWAEYAAVCAYSSLRTLPETGNLFATFKPLD